ncbi:hypothetical protein R3P38DRAFT_3279276 [Favolaschia claudopus]|uniref:BTB domain-containing protein n=1 Tax=Favolaschia claudopus TaxID=2862362 RepID=A0AAW0AJ37_9AGAR
MSVGDTADPIDAQSPADNTSSASRHQDYYLQTVVFKGRSWIQVEDCLFNVPRYHFERGSEVFAGMFSVPQPGGDTCKEGQGDSNPIVLVGKSSADFQALLKILYPLDIEPVMKNSSTWMTTGEWISVLKLSTEWRFLHIRKMAIEMLASTTEISSVQRIVLARKYEVASWLCRGYLELAQSTESISDEEGELLGWKTAFRLIQARERTPSVRLMNCVNCGCSQCLECSNCGRRQVPQNQARAGSIDAIVESIFAEEFRQAELASAEY